MKRVACGAVVFAIVFAACGGGEKVGSAFKEFKGGKAGERIGELQNSPSPKPKIGGAASTAVKTPAPTPKPAAQQQSSLNVQITATGFNPTAARVLQGSTVKVTNVDNKPHTYTSSDATYDTGSLGPGQSKVFTASVPGSFQIEDRTRNWILGSLEVVRR